MKRFVVLFSLVSASLGCGAIRASQARSATIRREVQAFTYQKPCTDVFATARTMLFSREFQVKSADATSGLTLETEWKTDKDGLTRYLLQGTASAPNTCQIAATRAWKNGKGASSMDRDWQMEWDLLKQVDATSANQIQQRADAAGEEASN